MNNLVSLDAGGAVILIFPLLFIFLILVAAIITGTVLLILHFSNKKSQREKAELRMREIEMAERRRQEFEMIERQRRERNGNDNDRR